MSRRKRPPVPNPLRFLAGAVIAAGAILFLTAMERLMQLPCTMAKVVACSEVPAPLAYAALAVAACGVLHSIYKAYRDFVLYEYLRDLAEAS